MYEEVELKINYILKKYHKFTKLWIPNSKRLVKHIPQDYKIKLKLGTIPKFFLIYKLIEMENLALKKIIKENLRKGYI